MDPINPISPWGPVRPIWPTRHENLPGFQPPLPDAIPDPLPKYGKKPAPEEPPLAPFEPEVPVPLAPAVARNLRRVLGDAGVRGMGPLGPGFALSEAELAQELQWVYRHIAKSLLEILPGEPQLPNAITAALAHDPRDEREMGMLLVAYPKLGHYLQMVINPGTLNRWQQQGERFNTTLTQHARSILGDLHLVESPTSRWRP
jgi:hypothetical protein